MSEFRLPDIGEGLDQAEIIEWLVQVGDVVRRDQPLVEVLTDKSQTQLPAPSAGTITRLGADVGDMVAVGEVLIEWTTTESNPPNDPAPAPASKPEPATTPAPVRSSMVAEGPVGARPKASPAVRKRAAELGIDLAGVAGTGPGGRITAADLDGAQSRPTPTPAPAVTASAAPRAVRAPTSPLGQATPGRHPLRGIRRVVATTMQQAWTVPHIHGADEFDARPLLSARAVLRSARPDLAALTPLTFMVMAVADALAHFPAVNASIDLDEGYVDVHDHISIGIAVATERGLIVPVVQHAHRLGVAAMAAEIRRLTDAARDGSITNADLTGGTCTVTNYGSLGGHFAAPIIKPPEAAIVGFGSIKDRPVVVDGVVVAAPTLPIAVGVDHRLIDGDVMTAFQEHIISRLLSPIVLTA